MTPEDCVSCTKRRLVNEWLPASLTVHTCVDCRRAYFDAVELDRRRAAQPRRSERLLFGTPTAWLMCLICDCLNAAPPPVMHVRCRRCGEEYERRSPPLRAVPETTLRELFEMVKRDPIDDQPRESFADALLERGDVRGEFIRLQLQDARSGPDFARARRINELLESHAWRWTPPGVDAARCEFHRGFLTRVYWPHGTDPAHDGWALVTTVDARPTHRHSGPRTASPLAGELLQRLERISRCGPTLVSWLVEVPPPRLRSLGMSVAPEESSAEVASRVEGVVNALAPLDELDLASERPFRWSEALFQRVGRHVKTLWLPLPVEPPRALCARVPAGLTLKLATIEQKERQRSVITLADGRIDVSLAAGELPEVARHLRVVERIVSARS